MTRDCPPKSVSISLIVNGQRVSYEVEPRMTLAEFLREKLDLTGTKVGCNRGECGSCTVLMDGRPVLSCTVLAVEAIDREVCTIEGLARDGTLHPIQEAFLEHDAFQCGYCTPGMILSAKALIDEKREPSRMEIQEALSGNLCRCTGYNKIIKAVEAAMKK